MVFPVVLAVGALALYFLTKPKKSDSDIYGKDSEPKKTEIKKDELPEKVLSGAEKTRYELRKIKEMNDKEKELYDEEKKVYKELNIKKHEKKLTNKELKEKIDKVTYKIKKGSDPNNPENYKKTFIDLGNYALDFKKRYEYVKISKTGNVILKGDKDDYPKYKRFIGKVKYDEGNKIYKLRTEGSRYSITLD